MANELDANQKTILENLATMMRKNAEQQFGGFFAVEGTKCENMTLPSMKVLGHIFGAIIVQGGDFRITVKIHSDMKPIRPLCAKNLLLPEDQVGERMIRDFLREIANLLGGAIRTELSRNNVDSGISLPLSSRGFDEVFFSSVDTDKNFTQAFKLTWPGGALVITQFIEITAWDSMQPMLEYKVDAPVVDEFDAMFT